jgi:hypothetical protein
MTTLQQGKQKWIEERYGVANLGRALGEKKTGRKKQRFHKTVKSLKTVAVFNGAEGGTRTLTGVTRYPLKIVSEIPRHPIACKIKLLYTINYT